MKKPLISISIGFLAWVAALSFVAAAGRSDGVLGGGLGRLAAMVEARGPADNEVRRELVRLARLGQVDLRSAPPRVRVRVVHDGADIEAIRSLGRVDGRMGSVISASVAVDALRSLGRLPGVRTVMPARRYRPLMDVSRPEIFGTATTDRFGLTGSGVLVAVVDTGIDWRHFDFRNPDGSTRIAAIWDQTDSSGTPPAGFTFGSVYDRAGIDFALAFPPFPLATADGFGHGTHVAGSAAANGQATGNGEPAGVFVGIAPQADLLIVRVFDNGGRFCNDCDLIAALDWIDQRATALGMPVVVNMSLGTDFGPHDGSDPDELAINAFVGTGRVVVVSAGNSRNDSIHTESTVVQGGTVSRVFQIPSYTPAAGAEDSISFDMWHDPADTLQVRLVSPDGMFTLTHTSGDGIVGLFTVDGFMRIEDSVDAVLGSGDREVQIEVSDAGGSPPRDGSWTIEVEGITVNGSGHFDIWTHDWSLGGKSPTWTMVVVDELVTSPATAQKGIAVGAYVTKKCWESTGSSNTCYTSNPTVGEIASFSSPGPTRHDPGRDLNSLQKPDVAAPGMGVMASFSGDAVVYPGDFWVALDGVHRNWQGTSMAAPHVAGVVALMLEANPAIGGLQARKFLRRNARLDAFAETGNDWGWGKVDTEAAVEDLLKLFLDLESQADPDAFAATAPANATSFNVYRGSLSDQDGSFYGTCFESGLAAPAFTDTTPEPAAGQGYFYIMTAVDGLVEGSLGQRSDGGLRPNLNPCP
jgi:subtilisin family serine protease